MTLILTKSVCISLQSLGRNLFSFTTSIFTNSEVNLCWPQIVPLMLCLFLYLRHLHQSLHTVPVRPTNWANYSMCMTLHSERPLCWTSWVVVPDFAAQLCTVQRLCSTTCLPKYIIIQKSTCCHYSSPSVLYLPSVNTFLHCCRDQLMWI